MMGIGGGSSREFCCAIHKVIHTRRRGTRQYGCTYLTMVAHEELDFTNVIFDASVEQRQSSRSSGVGVMDYSWRLVRLVVVLRCLRFACLFVAARVCVCLCVFAHDCAYMCVFVRTCA